MAGFFGLGNYAKPGRGVDKDEPQKNAFFLFFEVYFRKFWKLIQMNLIFLLACIPFFLPFLLINLVNRNIVVYYITMVPFIGVAMVVTGFAYVMRNFARQEHAFIVMDFLDTIKKNWKQSLQVGTIDFIVFFIMTFALSFYHAQIEANFWYVIPFILCVVLTCIFSFMQFYLFTMLLTFDLTLKQLLRNAAIFAFAGLFRNILIAIIGGLLTLIIWFFFPISVVLILFIAVSTFGFAVSFITWPLMKKFMMPQDEESEEDEDLIFKDTGRTD